MFSSTKIMQALSPAGAATGYQIARSLRFNSADSAYLNRTPTANGNRKTWTWSGWLKRSALGTEQKPIAWGTPTTSEAGLSFRTDNAFEFYQFATTYTMQLISTQVFRDPGSFFHLLIAVDTTQSTASDRVKIYQNGIQITQFSTATYPAQNLDTYANSTSFAGYIGVLFGQTNYFGGYMADVRFIDGQALTPSSFGETDSATGVWVPKAYTGTYGTNGFWLKFDDNSGTTSTTLGKDSSGNGNNWTPNNFSVTAGVGNDSLVDSPTNYGTDTGAGGEVRGNYCTWNPLDNGGLTLANGNMDASRATASWASARSTFAVTSGKWYWEVTPTSGVSSGTTTGQMMIGIAKSDAVLTGFYQSATGWGYFYNDGNKFNNNAGATYGVTYGNNDVIGVAFDADAGTLTFYKNGVSQGTAYTGLTSGPYFPAVAHYGTSASSANFGQRPFAYTAPSGFKALCTQNLPTPTIGTSSTNLADDYFNVVTYTGTGSSLSITGVGFQPDLVWIKSRSGATDHALYDAVRGVQKQLESNTTTDETTESTGLTAFGTDGFTVGALAQLNTSAATYVGWNWKESATSGFDIVTYTGNGANRTIAHNLGAAPKMLIVKARTTAGTDTGWPVWHTGIANTNYLELNATTASTSGTTYWNSTSPTSSVFSVGTAAAVNTNNDTYVAYLFAEVTGFSKIGTYTGNGNADGPFVYCGFRPKFVMSKNASSAVQGWTIQNPANQNYNEINNYVLAQSANAETGTFAKIDFLSNGFKIRTSDPLVNGDTNNIIFIAFAENPFNYSRAR